MTRKSAVFLAVLFLLSLLLSSCGEADFTGTYADSRFFAMDTVVTVRLSQDGNSADLLKDAAARCEDRLRELDRLYSVHDEESPLYHLNHSADPLTNADSRLVSLLHTADALSRFTNGAFDDTLGALSKLWNIPGGGPVPSGDAIRETLAHTGAACFTVTDDGVVRNDPCAMLDLGGIAKGAATEELVSLLRDCGIGHGLVSVGGNIGVFGEKETGDPFKIGVRDPDDPDGVIGYLYLTSGFVSVSGDYERYFEQDGVRYHHILDSRTGYPADSGLRSAAVFSENGAEADALSTALFVLGYDGAMERYADGGYPFEAVFILDNHHVRVTPGLADLFELTADGYVLDPISDTES